MNYRNVLKCYAQLRQLTDNETALLNTLRSMSESEREMLAETLGPPTPTKSSKPAAKRKIEKCGAELVNGDTCGLTRRAAIHKPDSSDVEAHEFFVSRGKSARASSLASAIKGAAGAKTTNNGNDDSGSDDSCTECTYVFGHNVHHLPSTEGYHEFVAATPAPQAVAENGGGGGE